MKYNKQILNPFDKIYNLPFSVSAAAGGGGGKEDPTKWEYFHIKNEYAGDNSFYVGFTSDQFTSANTEYSFDKETWIPLILDGMQYILLPEGSTVYFRGTDWSRRGRRSRLITCTENFSVGGCILSLLDYTNMKNITAIPENFALCMFYYNEKLIKADFNIGNATSVGANGFNTCFDSCSNLTTTPNFSNITSVGNYGFNSCFASCSNLNYVYAPSVSEWNVYKFESWLEGVSSEGTMSCPQGVEIPTATSGIPEGWTRVDR